MPLWRDPMEELISELERGLPAGLAEDDQMPAFEEVQFAISAFRRAHTPEEKARAEQDPYVKKYLAYYARHPPGLYAKA